MGGYTVHHARRPAEPCAAVAVLQLPRLSVQYPLDHAPAAEWSFNRTIPALLAFFEQWSSAIITPSDATVSTATRRLRGGEISYAIPLWGLASGTSNSARLGDPKLLGWLERFVRARGEFMDSE